MCDIQYQEIPVDLTNRICVYCKYHRVNPYAGNVLCAHPNVAKEPENPPEGFVAGVPARIMREMWGFFDDEESLKEEFPEICGKEGRWFSKQS